LAGGVLVEGWVNVLHLFAGAGGGVLADRLLGFRSVGYVEIEPYCQAVLKARIADGSIDPAPIFGDVREFIRVGAFRVT
jgi:DNA (cytosine-5)-methyltransferase 1